MVAAITQARAGKVNLTAGQEGEEVRWWRRVTAPAVPFSPRASHKAPNLRKPYRTLRRSLVRMSRRRCCL
eukprot:CAMPEP_0119384938 /NCGR_PEP_ID=MMETSP1334-20130426/88449_1 /TAXON_ID=127549 /ORGANISM="Calcidiscus leptoporus, Strain RCC1130" /LENGTH=69 /DNA_ID=CAMNT_0007406097 /DNA_START=283 /DNA_END=489 /DNA_ORIENTATION=-